MTDCVLIQNGVAHEIWRGKAKSALQPFAPALVEQIVEVTSDTVNEGDVWSGTAFSRPAPPAPPSIIPYATFRERWTDDEKAALHAALPTSWQIDDFVRLATAQNSVNLMSATGVAAKAALVSAGVLTQDRANVIFAA